MLFARYSSVVGEEYFIFRTPLGSVDVVQVPGISLLSRSTTYVVTPVKLPSAS
ncbi:hypothetical protein ABVF11_04965 [Pediococcus argentinicus]|uniref:hypothetical protein n=1 Tax=Pediococcus argentinicus TaxID=480391 RepID=UPI00338E81DE